MRSSLENVNERLIQEYTNDWMLLYQKDIADTLDINFLKVMKSDRINAAKFMRTVDLSTLKDFFDFVQTAKIHINWFIFFNNFFTKLPWGMIYTKIYGINAHEELKRLQTEPVINVLPEVVDEGKSQKYIYQSMDHFFSDMTNLLQKHAIQENAISLLIEQRMYWKDSMQIDTILYQTLLPVYYDARKLWYNHNDLCD